MRRPFKRIRKIGPFAQLMDSQDETFINVSSEELPGFNDAAGDTQTFKLEEAAIIEARINEETNISSRNARLDVADEMFMGIISMRVNDSDIFADTLIQIEDIVEEEMDIDIAKTIVSCDSTASGRFN